MLRSLLQAVRRFLPHCPRVETHVEEGPTNGLSREVLYTLQELDLSLIFQCVGGHVVNLCVDASTINLHHYGRKLVTKFSAFSTIKICQLTIHHTKNALKIRSLIG